MFGIIAAIIAAHKGHQTFAWVIGVWTAVAICLALSGVGIAVAPGPLFLVISLCMSKTTENTDGIVRNTEEQSAAPEKKFLCKSCGTYHTGWYQTCPTCGAVGTMEKAGRQEYLRQTEAVVNLQQNNPALTLYGLTGAFAGTAIPVSGTLTVGREEGNRILYPAKTPGISRRHCIITAKGTGVYISDCGSSCGTWINKTFRIPENKEFEIHAGDTISLGSDQESFVLQ